MEANHRPSTVQISISLQLLIYLAAATAIMLGYTEPLYFFFLPSFLAMPPMRAFTAALKGSPKSLIEYSSTWRRPRLEKP